MTSLRDATSSWSVARDRERSGVLLIADDIAARDAETAIEDSALRSLGRVSWDGAVARLEQQGLVSVVLAEAIGADDAALARVLPVLDALAARQDSAVVVTLMAGQIDVVTANLGSRYVELLCDPTPAERFAALCVAGPALDAVNDASREVEAVRLRRLNEEVARIAETLARLTRGDSPAPGDVPRRSAGVGEGAMAFRASPLTIDTPEIAARDIREAIRARRLRDQFFGGGLFEDPAWDMLLDLFAAEIERAQVSVSSLCIAASVAPTTALRWIARMTDAGLFVRQPDPFDRRRAFMGLSDRASAGMRSCVTAVRNAGLRIA